MSLAAAQDAPGIETNRLLLLDEPQEQAGFTRTVQLPGGTPRAVSQFALSGLYCASCAGIIEDALMKVDGVVDARVVSESARAEVTWDPARTRPSRLVAAVQRAGYDAAPDLAAPARELRERAWRRSLWQLFVAGFCMMQVMMYAAPSYFAAPGDISPDMLRLLQWASWLLSIPVLLFSASDMLRSAWRNLLDRRIGMDVPVAVGIIVTFVASTGATVDPGGIFGHEVYFDSLTMFVFFLLGGRALELRARHRIAASLEGAMADLPDSVARIEADGSITTITRRQLRVGDRVRVSAGQCFPADGQVLSGLTQANEAMLTGESSPVPKRVGDEVSAGSFNLMAPVEMAVQRLGADTRYEAIVSLVRGAMTARPESVRLADRWAGAFLVAVLLLAAGAAAVWAIIEPARAVWVAVSVLIVTCPCALSLATPSALLSAAGALVHRGVLLQRLGALETLARVNWLFVDKTGTLTEDRLELRGMHVLPASDTQDSTELLNQAAGLAAFSSHPLSRALVAAAGASAAPLAWQQIDEMPGEGLRAHLPDGREFRLGSLAWVRGPAALAESPASAGKGTSEGTDAGMSARAASGTSSGTSSVTSASAPGSEPSLEPAEVPPESSAVELWFGTAGRPWVRFELDECLRPDAAAALQRLQQAGVHIALLSGDRPERVRAMAARLGVADAQGGATPESKLQAMARAQAKGHCVAMVGDGLNDAPVLARADVSFAFAHGAALSQGHADVVLLGSRLSAVADARELSQRTLRVIRQNLTWAAVYNGTCIPLALIGWLPPWAAGLGMAGSSLLVVLNALRLSRTPATAATSD